MYLPFGKDILLSSIRSTIAGAVTEFLHRARFLLTAISVTRVMPGVTNDVTLPFCSAASGFIGAADNVSNGRRRANFMSPPIHLSSLAVSRLAAHAACDLIVAMNRSHCCLPHTRKTCCEIVIKISLLLIFTSFSLILITSEITREEN